MLDLKWKPGGGSGKEWAASRWITFERSPLLLQMVHSLTPFGFPAMGRDSMSCARMRNGWGWQRAGCFRFMNRYEIKRKNK